MDARNLKKPKFAYLLRHQKEDGKYVCKEEHVKNQPWGICKDQKLKLEAQKWPPFTYFQIIETEKYFKQKNGTESKTQTRNVSKT